MSIMSCEFCGKPTAKNAKSCPHCGGKLYRTSELTKVLLWVFGFGLLLFIVGMIKAMG